MFSDVFSVPPLVILIAQLLIAFALLLTGIRLYRGPTIFDRIVALDLIGGLIMAEAAILAVASEYVSYLDVASAIAVIGFLATVAFARYLENKEAPI